ncbi:MAG: septal ring lytic transglycosylase RlpA family protein [Chloroflexi bacterium]|nr:septal ring lytic transglycosylase RlpA family protein [Chloroflexota bacterium]
MAGATATLVGSQIVLSTLFSAPSLANVQPTDLKTVPDPGPALGTSGQMNAAVYAGQFEDLVKPTPVPTLAPTVVPTPRPTPAPTATLFEAGIASTYGEGDGFEGNLTACGQVFHTSVVQVAHKSLPCGTTVRVEDSDTGRSVVASVTDRGPYIPGRIVDLSWGAFAQLDPTGPGLLHVNVYIVEQ